MAYQPQQRTPARNDRGGEADQDFFDWLKQNVVLAVPGPDLFDETAKEIARTLRPHPGNRRSSNKTTQIRRFYDELLRYRSAARTDEEVAKILPFIRMINAKAAYASQRDSDGAPLVDRNFREFLRVVLDQVVDRRTLENACTLFEAVIGFSPRN